MSLNTVRFEGLKDRLKLSNKDISEAVGVKENTVWRWMNSRSQPASIHLSKLAEVLGTSSSYLLGDTDDPAPPPSIRSGMNEKEYRFLDAIRRKNWVDLMRLIGEDN